MGKTPGKNSWLWNSCFVCSRSPGSSLHGGLAASHRREEAPVDHAQVQVLAGTVALGSGLIAAKNPIFAFEVDQFNKISGSNAVALGLCPAPRSVSISLQPGTLRSLISLRMGCWGRIRRIIRTAIHLSLKPLTSGLYTERIEGNRMSDRDCEWIEKYRAALDKNPPRSERRLFRPVLAAIALTALCLGSAIYVFSVHLIR